MPLSTFCQETLPASLHHAAHPQRAEYLQDSLNIRKLQAQDWDLYWLEKLDSLSLISCEILNLAAKWMDRDSLCRGLYHHVESGIGQVLCMQGYFDQGLPIFLEGIKSMAPYPQVDLERSQNMVGLGWIYESMGDLEKALECHIVADHIQGQLVKAGKLTADWLAPKARNLANIYYKLGQYQQSEGLFHRAADNAFDSWGIGGQKVQLLNLMGFYLKIGEHEKARQIIIDTELFVQNPPDGRSYIQLHADLHLSLANAYYDLDSLSRAEFYYNQYLKIIEPLHMPSNTVAGILLKLTRINLAFHQLKKAQYFLAQAKQTWLTQNTAQNNFWAELTLLEGEIQLQLENWPAALKIFDAVLQTYLPEWPLAKPAAVKEMARWPINPWVMQALRGRMQVILDQWKSGEDTGQLPVVLSAAQTAQQYLEYLMQSFSTEYSKSKLFSENRLVYEIPIQLLLEQYQTSGDNACIEQLFVNFEKSKALQLLSSVKEKQFQAAYGISDQLLARERIIGRDMTFYKNLLAGFYKTRQDSLALKFYYQDILGKLQLSYDSLQLILQHQYPDYYQLRYDLSVTTLSSLQDQLDANEGLISYFWGAERIYALGISKREVQAWSVSLDSSLQQQLADFRLLVISPPDNKSTHFSQVSPSWIDQGGKLYRALIAPAFQNEAQITHLQLIPDGPLTYLPWACIPTGQVTGVGSFLDLPYLIRKYALQQEYSATLLLADIPRSETAFAYLGYAPEYLNTAMNADIGLDTLRMRRAFGADFRDGYAPLLYNLPEVQNAARYYTSSHQFTGAEATELHFKSKAPQGQILHLAMHAYTNDTDPMLSHLAFAPSPDRTEDGFLYAYELYNMDLPAELAVLSACNTGAGLLQDGQGVMSLARAFKYAGCRDVLMTLWPAHDRSTSEIMAAFFQELQKDQPKAGALQKATLQYLLEQPNPALIHPHYWAGFTLIGAGDTLYHPHAQWSWIFGIVLLILIITLLAIFGRSVVARR